MKPEERDAIYQHNADDPLMIIYDDDFDGFGAALVAVQVLGRGAVELVPVHHGDLPPQVPACARTICSIWRRSTRYLRSVSASSTEEVRVIRATIPGS